MQCGRRGLNLAECRQFAFEQRLIAEIQLHQPAQVADRLQVDVLADEAEEAALVTGQAHFHVHLDVAAQIYQRAERLFRIARPLGRALHQQAVQGDILQRTHPALIALGNLGHGVECNALETPTFVVIATHLGVLGVFHTIATPWRTCASGSSAAFRGRRARSSENPPDGSRMRHWGAFGGLVLRAQAGNTSARRFAYWQRAAND